MMKKLKKGETIKIFVFLETKQGFRRTREIILGPAELKAGDTDLYYKISLEKKKIKRQGQWQDGW
jgi:hypothetical protein